MTVIDKNKKKIKNWTNGDALKLDECNKFSYGERSIVFIHVVVYEM